MTDDEVQFGTLHEDGTLTNERVIRQSSMQACPHFIMVPEHYRKDESCRCNDPTHVEMAEWGYAWIDGLWRADPDEEGT